MKWRMHDEYSALSDPPGYVINRTGVDPVVYVAVRLGESDGRNWRNSVILHVERGIPATDDQARTVARKRCIEACRRDAAARQDETTP